jgi:type VI secretion system protein ImpG
MRFNRYYQDELAYLRELGAEFTKQNPDLAPYLSEQSKDPDVERLIEAFAFLTGRLRERLDDGLPEVVHGLLTLLWPQALRPIPCTTTIQFEPVKGVVTGTETVAPGIQLLSKSVEGISCSFRTCFATAVHPFAITATEVEEVGGRGLLRLTVTPSGEVAPDQLQMSSLRLFLNFHADPAAGAELRLLLCRHVRSMRIITAGGVVMPLPKAAIRPVGFTPEQAVLHASETSFDALRVLQEFLTVPEKFFFLDLVGLPAAGSFAGGAFSIVFDFDRAFHGLTRLSPDQIRLNCTPAINLFEADAEPIALTQQLTEYRLLTTDPNNISVVDVLEVTGWLRGRAERVAYEKFESFHRRPRGEGASFYVRLRPSVTRHQYEHYLSFTLDRDGQAAPPAELALARISCCNGTLPELLGIGDIQHAGSNAPVWARARNISPVSGFVAPQLDALRLWSVISIMARNYYPVSHVEGLRNLLGHLNFRALADRRASRRHELMVQALQAVQTQPIDMLVKGRLVRGSRITMQVDEDAMEGIGRAFLFGEVMDHLLALFANVNACHRFHLRCTRSNMTYDWPLRPGAVAPI